MTLAELMAENAALRLERAQLHNDVLHKNAAIDHHKSLTLKATQRALVAETEVEALRKAVEQITVSRDEWQDRWCKGQEQVQRWFKAYGTTIQSPAEGA